MEQVQEETTGALATEAPTTDVVAMSGEEDTELEAMQVVT